MNYQKDLTIEIRTTNYLKISIKGTFDSEELKSIIESLNTIKL